MGKAGTMRAPDVHTEGKQALDGSDVNDAHTVLPVITVQLDKKFSTIVTPRSCSTAHRSNKPDH